MSEESNHSDVPKIAYDDVDKLIEIAARKERAAAEQIDLAMLSDIADDLGIAKEHVEAAVQELDRRRAEKVRRESERRERLKGGAIAAGVIALIVVGSAWFGQAQLRSDLSEARQQQSQVANVVERHRTTAEYFADEPDSVDRSAELQGALNRVSVETRRYDEAASQYNRRASGLPSSVWVRLFGLPDELPLSDEIDEW